MKRAIVVGALGFGVAFAALAAAEAPSCPSGQAATAKTAGRCCWPGQRWSVAKSACVDTPQCPPEFDVSGETCVAKPAPVQCPAGQSVSIDTAGHCCWQNQAWSTSRSLCVGVPLCPVGLESAGETCAPKAVECPRGQSITDDTGGHCCWGGQVWSKARETCIGIPQCPPDLQAQGEACVPAQVLAPPPLAPYATPFAPPFPPSASPFFKAPVASSPPEILWKRRSLGMMIGGWIGVGLGGVAFAAGLPLALTAKNSSNCPSNYLAGSSCVNSGQQTGGTALALGGGSAFLVGFIIATIGGTKVPVREKTAIAPAPTLHIGPADASLTCSF
jgi:hypothetical protein